MFAHGAQQQVKRLRSRSTSDEACNTDSFNISFLFAQIENSIPRFSRAFLSRGDGFVRTPFTNLFATTTVPADNTVSLQARNCSRVRARSIKRAQRMEGDSRRKRKRKARQTGVCVCVCVYARAWASCRVNVLPLHMLFRAVQLNIPYDIDKCMYKASGL